MYEVGCNVVGGMAGLMRSGVGNVPRRGRLEQLRVGWLITGERVPLDYADRLARVSDGILKRCLLSDTGALKNALR
jgi:hypothetical protein